MVQKVSIELYLFYRHRQLAEFLEHEVVLLPATQLHVMFRLVLPNCADELPVVYGPNGALKDEVVRQVAGWGKPRVIRLL